MLKFAILLIALAHAQDEVEDATRAVSKPVGDLRKGDSVHVEGSYAPGANCPKDTPVYMQVYDGANWQNRQTFSSSGDQTPNIRFDYTAKIAGAHRVWVEPKVDQSGCTFTASLTVQVTKKAEADEGEEAE